MTSFRCKMTDRDGRVVEKTLSADSKAALKSRLEGEGCYVLDIKKEGGFTLFKEKKAGPRKIKSRDFFSFNQEFSVLIRAGLPIVGALDALLEKSREGDMVEVLKRIREDVIGGASLSEAFEKYSHLFSHLYTASLQAGEKSGDLPLALTRFIDYLKKTEDIKKKVVSASVYPLILTVVSVLVLIFLLVFVVPVLSETFMDSGRQLPAITVLLVTISSGLKENMGYIFLFLLGGGIGLYYFAKSKSGKALIDRYKIKIPFLGEVYLHYTMSKWSRTLATVLSGGIPLVETVKISSGTVDNDFLQVKISEVIKKLEEGEGFSEALSQAEVFPHLSVRMISAGEDSGALDMVLGEIADFYSDEVDLKLSILTSTIEPALMVVMGFMIGFIVLAMYMPIFQMAGGVN